MKETTRIIVVFPNPVLAAVEEYRRESERRAAMPISRQKIVIKLLRIGLKEAASYD